MSGGGATGPAFDAAGNALRISPARGGIALYDPSVMKTPEIPPLEILGETLQYKNWLRRLTLLLKQSKCMMFLMTTLTILHQLNIKKLFHL